MPGQSDDVEKEKTRDVHDAGDSQRRVISGKPADEHIIEGQGDGGDQDQKKSGETVVFQIKSVHDIDEDDACHRQQHEESLCAADLFSQKHSGCDHRENRDDSIDDSGLGRRDQCHTQRLKEEEDEGISDAVGQDFQKITEAYPESTGTQEREEKDGQRRSVNL